MHVRPADFPLNCVKQLNLPIFGKNNKEGYFFRQYQEVKGYSLASPEDLLKYKYEIVYGSLIEGGNYTKKYSCDSVLPICMEDRKNTLKVMQDGEVVSKLINLPSKRFHYFNLMKGSRYNFQSSNNFIVGRPISLKQRVKHKKKLVLCIFVDALTADTKTVNYKDLMPNTMDFFKQGVKFNNHYANAEWTLPSAAGFFTGSYHQDHLFYHPGKSHVVGKNSLILSEIFRKNEYSTFHANSNSGLSPALGYVKGFDRTVYKKEMGVTDVVHAFLEHMNTFKSRDNFAWLSIMDIHHLLNFIPDISSQVNNSISAHCLTPAHDDENMEKSVFISQDKNLTEIYANEIKRIDFYLGIIYDYINKFYEEDEVLVTLFSDHGQAFLDNDRHPLSEARNRIPWMISGGGVQPQEATELTESIDLFSTLIHCCNLEVNKRSSNSNIPVALGGAQEKNFVISQSIYPGQPYRAVIRGKNFEYRFESIKSVADNGKIEGEIVLKNYDNFKGDGNSSKYIDKYMLVVQSKIKQWNYSVTK